MCSVSTMQYGGGAVLPASLEPWGPRVRTDIDNRLSLQTGPGEKACTQSGNAAGGYVQHGESTEILRAAFVPCTW